ncbi:MAG: hypothetical protein J5J00_17570 [Deltaproteobacteria bacterium]|nr:hypothetical protein [Deltaproteobacteria bacterium]
MPDEYFPWIRAILSASAAGLVYLSRPFLSKLLFLFLAVAGLWAFTNFGRFHTPLNEKIHYWDSFHYFLGAKYFDELHYSGLYSSAVIAGKEQGVFGTVASFRDQRSYKVLPVALIDPTKVMSRFTPERWREFKHDVLFFVRQSGRPDEAWQRLFLDHGYNAPPLKSKIMSFILNAAQLSEGFLNFIVAIDYFLMLALIVSASLFLGAGPAMLCTSAFSLNALAPFDFTFGSVLRYDWYLFLGMALIALSKRRDALSGVLFAVSTHCRIFPLMLTLPVALHLIKHKERLAKFLLGFLAAGVLGVIPALFSPSGVSLYFEFAEKMQVHREQVYSNTIGMKQLALIDTLSLTEDPAPTAQAEIARRIKQRSEAAEGLGILFALCALIAAIAGKCLLSVVITGCFLVFTLIGPVNYYYAFLAFLPLIAWADDRPVGRAICAMVFLAFFLLHLAQYYFSSLLSQSVVSSFIVFALLLVAQVLLLRREGEADTGSIEAFSRSAKKQPQDQRPS